VELDIYNKPYPEKIKRISLMKEQGNLAMKTLAASEDQTETLEKASYYYAQALLIFYYLIPDNDE